MTVYGGSLETPRFQRFTLTTLCSKKCNPAGATGRSAATPPWSMGTVSPSALTDVHPTRGSSR